MLILLALQSNSTGSVLANDVTLGAGIRELKPGVAAPIVRPAVDPSLVYTIAKTHYWVQLLCVD